MASDPSQVYQSYRGVPSFAGISTLSAALQPGLGVEECVRRIKRYHYAFKRLHQIFLAHITAEPVYELKMAFSLHSYLCAEHVTAMRTRVAEMREPPLGLDVVPDASLALFFDEILAAPRTEELLVGLYEKALPALQQALERHLAQTHPIADYPSTRICRFALSELTQMLDFGSQAITALVDQSARTAMADWLEVLDRALAASGALDGVDDPVEQSPVERLYSAQPFVYQRVPRRDERFPDPYNMGVNAEIFVYNEKYPVDAKVLMLLYKRMREIDVPEMMASILMDTRDQRWEYYRDITRHLWDEARHALLGEVGLINLGVDWRKIMFNFTWSLELNTRLTPRERHGIVYFIEQGLMPRMGKRYEWELARLAHDELATTIHDFDWADEVLHTHFGRTWYVSGFPDRQQALQFADHAWSKALLDWEHYRDAGLTQHRNWWPEVYLDACRQRGSEPDPATLAYQETYANKRPDRKEINAVG